MKSLPIVLMAALASAPIAASAQRDPVRTVTPSAPSGGLGVHNTVPTAPVSSIKVPVVRNPAPVSSIKVPVVHNTVPASVFNGAAVHNPATPVGTAPQSHLSATRETNPVYDRPAWGWNHGVVWMPQGKYWGGAFWGAHLPGAAMTAKIMGSIIHGNQIYQSYGVTPGSPGAMLLSNYGLRQVQCGTPGLVVIYGPSFGVVCAYPNYRVGAGNYTVNVNSLTITQRS